MDIILSRRFPVQIEDSHSAQEVLRDIAASLKKELEKELDFTTEESGESIPDVSILKGNNKASPRLFHWRIRFEGAFEIDYCEHDSTVRIGARGRTLPPAWLALGLGVVAFHVLGFLALALGAPVLFPVLGVLDVLLVLFFALVYASHLFTATAPPKSIECILEKMEREFSSAP